MTERLSILVLDDGELDDVQGMIEEMGLEFGRVRGGAIVPDTPPPRRLLVSTPRRIEAVRHFSEELDGDDQPVRIVVVDGDSNTLRAKLREIGFDYLVRRPVHPEALRLLLMRCLYEGEERRREPRVPVGYEISFKAGLLQRRATLADLSSGGCRLLTSYALQPGKRIKLQIPEALGAAEPLTLAGRVLRKEFDPELGESGLYVAAIAFEELGAEQRQELDWILEERGRGPAMLGDAAARPDDPRAEAAPGEPRHRTPRPDPRVEPESGAPLRVEETGVPARGLVPRVISAERERPPRSARRQHAAPVATDEPDESGPEAESERPAPMEEPTQELRRVDLEVAVSMQREIDGLPEEQDDDDDDEVPQLVGESPRPRRRAAAAPAAQKPQADGDRRRSPRSTFGRKVPAFGSRALRVLMGRDLSRGGMRVERFPELELGDRLHLAIYGDAGEEPFLVWATVARDDGEDGLALVFDEVHSIVGEQLDKLVGSLPAVECLHDDEVRAMGTVVGEVLDS